MKAPYFPLFVNNWLGSSRITTFTPAEEGAYIRLLCYEWNDEKCSLPTDDESLAVLSRLGPEWSKSSAKIRSCFENHDGRLYNEKLLSLRMEADELRAKRQAGGVKGMISRWHKSVITDKLPTPTPTPTPTDTSTPTPTDSFPSPKKKNNKRVKNFIPPTPSEVEEYSKSIGYAMNGQAWCDSYEQKGWMVGKTKMRDWKCAVRHWKAQGWLPSKTEPPRNMI